MARDFHTHNQMPEIRALISTHLFIPGQLTSLEIHPWKLPGNFDPAILPGTEFAEKFSAIGEIGLDKLHGTDYDIQKKYFIELLKIAADCRKPVVIHAVRSFQEIFSVLKSFAQLKVMFHGFRSSPEMVEELWKRNITVSFHPQIINSPALLTKLKNPAGAFGFESDNDRNISVPQLLTGIKEISGINNIEKMTDQYFDDFLEI